MPSAVDDMAVGQIFAAREWAQRREAEDPNLATMRMPGQGQRDTPRNGRKDVGLVRHKEDRSLVGHLRQGAGQIVAAAPIAPRQERFLISEPGNPERATVILQPENRILHHWNAACLQRALRLHRPAPSRLRDFVIPPIMVAEDGMDTERGSQPPITRANSTSGTLRVVTLGPDG